MTEIHALHGFLGLPEDWQHLKLPNLKTYDLSDTPIAPSSDGYWGWAQRFNHYASPKDGILLGYSLGGRLAMHALLENPSKWKAGIIISSHTGFKTEKEKAIRIQSDKYWAERFENEPWEKILQDWNAQSVFAGFDYPLVRLEKKFSRKHLGDLLRRFSRGHQDDISKAVQNLQVPILWINGKLDITFRTVAKELSFAHPFSRVEVVEGSAHRVPWEQPEKFLKLIQSFLYEVSSCL